MRGCYDRRVLLAVGAPNDLPKCTIEALHLVVAKYYESMMLFTASLGSLSAVMVLREVVATHRRKIVAIRLSAPLVAGVSFT